jgi:hypothetical protein
MILFYFERHQNRTIYLASQHCFNKKIYKKYYLLNYTCLTVLKKMEQKKK